MKSLGKGSCVMRTLALTAVHILRKSHNYYFSFQIYYGFFHFFKKFFG